MFFCTFFLWREKEKRHSFPGMGLTAGAVIPKDLSLTVRDTDACPAKTVEFTTEQLFGGKRSVVFALPGAFTSTCRQEECG
jgi:peroxiredoxin